MSEHENTDEEVGQEELTADAEHADAEDNSASEASGRPPVVVSANVKAPPKPAIAYARTHVGPAPFFYALFALLSTGLISAAFAQWRLISEHTEAFLDALLFRSGAETATAPTVIDAGLPLDSLQHLNVLAELSESTAAVNATDFQAPLALFAAALLGQTLTAWWMRRRARNLQPGTNGKGRVLFRGWVGPLATLSLTAVFAILFYGATQAAQNGFTFSFGLDESVLALNPDQHTGLLVAGGLAILLHILDLGSAISAWFLLPRKTRTVFWILVDIGLTAALVWSSETLPLQPTTTELADLVEPSIRLSITALWAIRMGLRLLPLSMTVFERTDFHLLIAARHLRSRKSGFLAAIGSLSILAVAVSSCMLTSVLSVMGGFRDDLKQKILGNHAHIVVDGPEGDEFEGWSPVLDAVREVPGVIAATPYLEGEVMATSASNRTSALLRGIDPDSIGSVTDLEENLTSGRLDYLRHPERLLDLPPAERRRVLPLNFSPEPFMQDDDEDDATDTAVDVGTGSLLRDIENIIDLPSGAEDDVRALRDAMEADAAMARNSSARAPPSPDDEDVLPGIIVGKELARTLRLFVGDEIDIISPFGALGPTGPMPKARSFRVAGIFYSGMYEYDMKLVYVLLPSAQRFLGRGSAISGIEAKVDDVEESREIAAAVQQALDPIRGELVVKDWQELNKNLFGALALEKLAMFVTLGIAVLIAGFCVFGTLTLMVQEKSREVGILKAMGTTSRSIVGIFLFEGLQIGVIGASVGLGFGYLVVFVLEHFGVRLNPEVYYIDRLPVHNDPIEFAVVGIAAVLVCLVATVFPALLASRLRPVDALRHF